MAEPSQPLLGAKSYDDVPYESHPFAQTHPNRLATVATLFGLRPVPVHRCRVLELGGASGGNLAPMADELRESQFVCIDYSPRQIEEGNRLVETLGLKNLELKYASILDVDESYGMFDYIICHGVYSWVPSNVQEKIHEICSKNLNLNGVAYISYNTYPGWHMRGMIRDMMRYHAERFTAAKVRTRQARALLDFLSQSVKQEGSAYAVLLKQELETLRHQADHYLFHEHLEEVNEPVYFYQFAERAMAKGLQYLGEARVGTMVLSNFGPDIEKTLRMLATDQIQVEQYMDFLRNRMFRETLLVHNKVQPNWAVQPEVLRRFLVGSPAVPVTEPVDLNDNQNTSFKSPSGMSMATNQPLLKAAMSVMRERWPIAMPFDELRAKSRELLGGTPSTETVQKDQSMLALGLLNCYMGSDLVEFHTYQQSFTKTVSEMPITTKIARMQAPNSQMVTNRRHEVVRLNDLDRQLLPLCDGEHTRDMMVEKLLKVTLDGALNVQQDNQSLTDPEKIRTALKGVLEPSLAGLGRHALLIG